MLPNDTFIGPIDHNCAYLIKKESGLGRPGNAQGNGKSNMRKLGSFVLSFACVAVGAVAQPMTQDTKASLEHYARVALAHWSCEHYVSREAAIRDNPENAEQSRQAWEREQRHFRAGLEAARRLYELMLAEWDKMEWSQNFDLRRHLQDLNSLDLPPVAAWGGRGPTIDFEAGRMYQRLQSQLNPPVGNPSERYLQDNCALLVWEPTPSGQHTKP